MNIYICTYGMYMTLDIFRPTCKCRRIVLRARSPERPQNTAFPERIQTCYTMHEPTSLKDPRQMQ